MDGQETSVKWEGCARGNKLSEDTGGRTTLRRQLPLQLEIRSLSAERESPLSIVPGAEEESLFETLAGPTANPVLVGVLYQ